VSMMKIGLLTLQCTDNYGAMLQAFALKQALSQFGKATVLDYRPQAFSGLLSDSVLSGGRSVSQKLGLLLSLQAQRRKRVQFCQYMQDKLEISGQPLLTHNDLAKAASSFDAVVCGSDQIWNPQLTGWDPAYFLSFPVPRHCLRIAYAASIGLDKPGTEEAQFIKKSAAWLDVLSVRENSAKDFLDSLGITCVRTADPVWLLEKEDWVAFARSRKDVPDEGYIFSYPMTKDPLFYHTQQAVARGLNMKLVTPFGSVKNRSKFDKMIFDASPEEFVGLLAASSCVVTNSFHGAAMALLLGKRCIVTAIQTKNSRLTTLMNAAGAERFLVNDTRTTTELRNLLDEYDPAAIAGRIAKERAESIKFLRNSLSGQKEV
jgi:hypothetical protein